MAEPAFDHIAVAARSLEEGREWLEDRLGVTLQPGGRHPLLGTHNMLLSLGQHEYLELIAMDPDADPTNAGWFGLRDFDGPPRIAGWVIRQSPIDPLVGTAITEISRGDLRWKITLPDTGQMPNDGAIPMRIEWGDAHPCDRLRDHGLRLTGLELRRPSPLTLPLSDPRISALTGPTRITARISTPSGEAIL